MNPRVFICHASDDKERFVLGFAEKLRTKGIDAWVDQWEMLPGDSLVEKVFEEGIPSSQAMIVVVSEYSVNKPWVREELNHGMVKKIEGDTKLIPIVIGKIDDSHIPETLKTTLWQRIGNLNNYEAELARIQMSIHGHLDKPPLGPLPDYVRTTLDKVPGLNEVDSLVLKLCGEALMNPDGHRLSIVDPDTISEPAEARGIHPDTTMESLEILADQHYIDTGGYKGTQILYFMVTDFGFREYAKSYLPGYESILRNVGLELTNHNRRDSEEIASVLEQPQAVVEYILMLFDSKGFITLPSFMRTSGGHTLVLETRPQLKRWLEQTS